MKKLLIATTNPGKLNEIRGFLSDLSIELVGLKDVGITENPEETGSTFEENAILKAKYYCNLSGLPTLSDDGGFEIDALDGEPGIHSHRWVNKDRESSDAELIAYTFERMKVISEANRGAQLRLVLAFVTPEGQVHTSTAAVRGIVPAQPASDWTPGFPYRAILYLPEIGKYYNQEIMTPEETEQYNHRRKAVLALRGDIEKYCTL